MPFSASNARADVIFLLEERFLDLALVSSVEGYPNAASHYRDFGVARDLLRVVSRTGWEKVLDLPRF